MLRKIISEDFENVKWDAIQAGGFAFRKVSKAVFIWCEGMDFVNVKVSEGV